MEMNTSDYIKKALLDTQERVRDYMSYSSKIEDKSLQSFFRDFAEVEGKHAEALQVFLSDLQ